MIKTNKLFFSLIFIFAFGFFIIPSNTFALQKEYSFQYVDTCEDCNIEEITNKILTNPDILKRWKDIAKCYIILTYPSVSSDNYRLTVNDDRIKYIIIHPYKTNFLVNIDESYVNKYLKVNYFPYSYMRLLDENFNVLTEYNDNSFGNNLYSFFNPDLSSTFYNNIISYNGVNFSFTDDTINLFYGDEKIATLDSNYDFANLRDDARKVINAPVKFEINSIDTISHKILSDDIPEKFNFLYLIIDYLICLVFVFTVCSPFLIIVRLIRRS